MRRPAPADAEFLRVQDAYLREETAGKGVTRAEDLDETEEGICLWKGDITALSCDAIVNAANAGLTGCYIPNHKCVDNCIHTFAGPELRLECAEIMERQKVPEQAGRAKITKAYNLPCRYVLHTVGPVVSGRPSEKDRACLASCYRSCLRLAAANGLSSVAFCCISTGEFHFPNGDAAEIAVNTVRECRGKGESVKRVIFTVFRDADLEIYRGILGRT